MYLLIFRATFYNFAKHLEKKGDLAGATQNFERSETHRFEVPRLLFEDWNMLETYIQKSSDKELKRWWAQYMESTGEMELALQVVCHFSSVFCHNSSWRVKRSRCVTCVSCGFVLEHTFFLRERRYRTEQIPKRDLSQTYP